jgi:hypothetical protein
MMWSVIFRVDVRWASASNPGRVDQYLAAQGRAVRGLQLQVGVDARAFAGRHLLDLPADLVEGEARVGVQGDPGQGVGRGVPTEAQHGELVVDGLVAAALQLGFEVVVDERRLAGGKGA